MQLILDAENIDIKRNMSTIEHEPLNEKFLANKVIDHLKDDITNGNKENIQKQENIIQDVEETNVVDTDKEMPSGAGDILTNNSNVIDTEAGQTSEKIIEINTKKTPEQVPDAVVIENVSKEFSPKRNEAKLEDTNNEDVNEKESTEESKDDLTSLDTNPTEDVPSTVEENNSKEVSNERNEDKKVELDNEVDISELPAKLNEEKVMDLNEEIDIASVSTELNEETEMDFDLLDDIAEVSTKLNEEKDIDLDKEDDIAEISTELNEEKEINLDKEDDIAEVSTKLNEEKDIDLDKEDDIAEISTELNEDKEIYLDKEYYIAAVSTKLNEEKGIYLDKEDDIAKVSTELNEENDIDLNKDNNIAEVSTKLNEEKEIDLDKDDYIAEVSTKLNEEKEIDLEKDDYIAEVSTEPKEVKVLDLDKDDDIAEASTELNEDIEMNVDTGDDIAEDSTELNEEIEMDVDKGDDIAEFLTELNEDIEIDLDKDYIAEVSTEVNEEKEMDVDKDNDIAEVSTKLNEEIEIDLDKDDYIAEVSTEPKEVKELDLDKNDDIAEVSAELNEEIEIDLDKNDYIAEVSIEPKEVKKFDLDQDNIAEVSTEVNEEKEIDLDKDIAEVSTEPKEVKELDLDKNDDIAEVSSELNNENDIEEDAEKATEEDLEKDSVQSEVPNTSLNDDSEEGDCSVIEPVHETDDNNTPIEIDDEDEQLSENNAENHENIDEVRESVDKNKGELSKEIDTSSEEGTMVNKTSKEPVQPKRICRLSNNLDIFSDEEEDDQSDAKSPNDNIHPETEKQCINIDDDDDIMLIDEDLGAKDSKEEDTTLEVMNTNFASNAIQSVPENTQNYLKPIIETEQESDTVEETSPSIKEDKDTIVPINETSDVPVSETDKTAAVRPEEKEKIKKSLLPKNFLDTCQKKISDMTRNDLEEFCILKIVESIVDRSNLGEIKTHLKILSQTMEECKKKCLILTKQNKDLQVVLKSVREEQKSGSDLNITPLKITRSVGLQVVMVDKNSQRRKPTNGVGPQAPVPNNNTKQVKNQHSPNTRNQKEKVPVNQPIPVPRLVPATPPQAKTNLCATNTAAKPVNNTVLPNGMRNSPPVQKIEKRPRSQAVTVDLTDDEPPAKMPNVQRSPVAQAMRVLTTGPNLVPAPRFAQNINTPRKVYIPISGPQAQGVRPGQTIMLKALSGIGPRPRTAAPTLIPKPSNPMRFARGHPHRHPAPLPDAMKQYQPPNWKSLPPAPDLKLSKVENGIVISWKIDAFQEDDHEEIASYQLYAYQETTSPPNTSLWKKIGDVKALPLPMACTLTQFMAGYKYYFSVRAVDIRSRYGPFSLPSSILLLNKM